MYKIINLVFLAFLLIARSSMCMEAFLNTVGEKGIAYIEKRYKELMEKTYQPQKKAIQFTKTPLFHTSKESKTTEKQTHEVAKATRQELKNHGLTFDDITRCVILVPDQENQAKVEKILKKFYSELMQQSTIEQTDKMPVAANIALDITAQRKKKAKL